MGRAEQEFRLQIRCSKTLDEAHALRGGLRRDRRPGGRPSSHPVRETRMAKAVSSGETSVSRPKNVTWELI